MKKGLLLLAAGAISAASFAQVAVPAVHYWKTGAWTAFETETATYKVNNYLASTDKDSTWTCTGLKNLTMWSTNGVTAVQNKGVADYAVWHTNEAQYTLKQDKTNEAIEVAFERKNAGTAAAPAFSEYANFAIDITKWTDGDRDKNVANNAPTASTTDMSKHTVGGFVLDLSDNFTFTGKINIPAEIIPYLPTAAGVSKDKFVLRASIVDIHGHEMNYGGDHWDMIDKSKCDGTWQDFSIDVEALAAVDFNTSYKADAGDGWSGDWNSMKRPVGNQGSTPKVSVPIDTAHVASVRFYFLPGEKPEMTAPVTIKMKDLVFGDADNALLFKTWSDGTVGIADAPEATSKEVASVEKLNILGQKVDASATGLVIIKTTYEDGSIESVNTIIAE